MNKIGSAAFLSRRRIRIMFGIVNSAGQFVSQHISSVSQMIASAIAYTRGMEDARIEVVEERGVFFLQGYAPTAAAIEEAGRVAASIAGACICNRIEPAS
jgi:osmotically-inducible protein OsmY